MHRPEKSNDFAIVHPLFFTDPKALYWLKKAHRYIIAIEVADTTKISKDYTLYANDPRINGVFLPSTFAIEAYKRSGVMNKLWLVPHGVNPIFGKVKSDVKTENKALKTLKEDKRIKILFFGLHSIENRKAGDVVREALRRLKEKGRDFLLVVKTHAPPLDYDLSSHFSGIPTVKINAWLSEEDLVYLYDSCDILLHPYRSGAFELNVFEALARGLPTIVTGWGAVLDYANIHNAYLITPESAVRVFPLTALGHIGYGVNPSVNHCVELLEFVMDNLEYCKRKAGRQRSEFVQRSWDRVADQILEGCREIWQIA
jgi:glycosyltransferase involved in cell wall biosynthesis